MKSFDCDQCLLIMRTWATSFARERKEKTSCSMLQPSTNTSWGRMGTSVNFFLLNYNQDGMIFFKYLVLYLFLIIS